MTDLTRKKVKEKIEQEIKFYDKEIQRSEENVENLPDEIDLERLKRERESRQRQLKQISG